MHVPDVPEVINHCLCYSPVPGNKYDGGVLLVKIINAKNIFFIIKLITCQCILMSVSGRSYRKRVKMFKLVIIIPLPYYM